MTYTEPPTSNLARLAAKAMSKTNPKKDWKYLGKDFYKQTIVGDPMISERPWHPETSHDHAQILVEDAAKCGILERYTWALLGDNFLTGKHTECFYLATPEQKTRAYLRAKAATASSGDNRS